MVFSWHVFIYYFLPLLLLVYYNLPYRGRNLFVVFMSYAFYGWCNPWFVVLLVSSTLLNYACGRILGAPRAGRRTRGITLADAITLDLALLGFFKYLMFFTEALNSLVEPFGHESLSVLLVTLPIGISFYTFQAISYVVDIYRGDAKPARSLVDYACFIAMFPHSIAGPIVRYHTIAEQLVGREHTVERFASGVPGWKTDRGRVYIMYGKPDELESHPTGGSYNRPFNEGGGTTTTFPFEKWWYRHLEGVGDRVCRDIF